MPPLFLCLKSNFGRGGLGVKFSPPITVFYWPEVTLKFWAKSELVKFFPDLGCPPPFFAYNQVLAEGGGGYKFSPPITTFYWPEITLKVWAKSELVEFLPNLGWLPPFCLKSSFGLGVGEIFTSNRNVIFAWGYPESLSQIQVGWIFASFGVPPPFFD